MTIPCSNQISETPEVPISWGELIDKITILEIKERRLQSNDARLNVKKELKILSERAQIVFDGDCATSLIDLKEKLAAINNDLWEIEDKIRQKEAAKEFDKEFIELARSVYITNDRRAKIKSEINKMLFSGLVEEKGYAPY